MLAQREMTVSYKAIRYWCHKFGPSFARSIRQRQRDVSYQCHVDEVFLEIKGRICYLCRAVDQGGQVLDILLQSRRNMQAALKFFRKLLKQQGYVPHILVTDKLRSYSAAHQEILGRSKHRSGRLTNNRVEKPDQPTRERERKMRWFKSPQHAQQFLAVQESSIPSSVQAATCIQHLYIGRCWVSSSPVGVN